MVKNANEQLEKVNLIKAEKGKKKKRKACFLPLFIINCRVFPFLFFFFFFFFYLSYIKVQGKVARRHVDEQQHVPNQGFEQLFNNEETVECMKLRKKAYEEAWKQTQTIINVRKNKSLFGYI